MSYSLAIKTLQILPEIISADFKELTCDEAYKGCMPSFVFSVTGQVAFRGALEHLVLCNKRQCLNLRSKVKKGILAKLIWLFRQEVLLGCLEIQPFLYRAHKPVDIQQQKNFLPIGSHLARCPHEPCARLRRAILLTVRDTVSPAAHQNKG